MGYINETDNVSRDLCIVMHWCESSLYKRIHVRQDAISLKEALRVSREICQVCMLALISVLTDLLGYGIPSFKRNCPS